MSGAISGRGRAARKEEGKCGKDMTVSAFNSAFAKASTAKRKRADVLDEAAGEVYDDYTDRLGRWRKDALRQKQQITKARLLQNRNELDGA